MLERLRVKSNWAQISNDGTISSLLDTFADSQSELARYMEYLLGEKKWTTAQNISSLITQTDLIGRKSHRKRSAIGYVVVSHTDIENIHRLKNYGQTFFNLDERSNYDNISKDPDPQYAIRTQALVPWTYPESYVIARGTRFLSARGIEYIATETRGIRALATPYDAIVSDTSKYEEFINSGGWDGVKYLKIPVIQGVKKSYTFGKAAGSRFETFILPVTNCEDASNTISKGFLRFLVTPSESAVTEEWTQVANILLAGPLDRVYEVINVPDYSGVLFKVGNGVTGQLLPPNATVSVEYLETAGEMGNIEKKYQINSIIFPDIANKIDPRSSSSLGDFLTATNLTTIMGGQDEESEEDIRANAPFDYLQYYAVATTEAYEKQIKMYSQIGLDKVKVFPGTLSNALTVTGNTVNTLQNVLYVTAITSSGEAIEDPQNQFVIPVTKALGDLKAPSDFFSYVEPNFIKIRLNTIVYSDDTGVSDEEVKAIEKQAMLDKYSIFNMDFKSPFHNSDFISTAQAFPFVNHVTAFSEAVADINYTPAVSEDASSGIWHYQGVNGLPTLYALKFKFDTMFANDTYARGFENYMQSAPYLLRIDLKIKNDPVKASLKNRTFFLFDERYLFDGTEVGADFPEDLEAAKLINLAGLPVITNGQPSPWLRPDERVEPTTITRDNSTYKLINRTARVAQYPLISRVTDPKTMSAQVKSFAKEPFEIRPWQVDTEGRPRLFPIAEVPLAERMLRSPNSTSSALQISYCYKADNRFIDYLDIGFTEYYDTPTSPLYAAGALIIPAEYFAFTNIDIDDPQQFSSALKNFVSLKVYAVPRTRDYFPTEWNEILFAEDEDIVVERVRNLS